MIVIWQSTTNSHESSKIARSMGSSCSQLLELLTCQSFGRKPWPRSSTSHLIPIEPYLSICVLISSPLRKWDVLSRFPGLLSRLKDMNWFISMHGQHPSKVTFAFPSFFKCRGNGIPPFYLAGSPYLIADTPLAKTPGMKGRTSYFGRIGFIIRSWTFVPDQSASDHCGWHRGAYRGSASSNGSTPVVREYTFWTESLSNTSSPPKRYGDGITPLLSLASLPFLSEPGPPNFSFLCVTSFHAIRMRFLEKKTPEPELYATDSNQQGEVTRITNLRDITEVPSVWSKVHLLSEKLGAETIGCQQVPEEARDPAQKPWSTSS